MSARCLSLFAITVALLPMLASAASYKYSFDCPDVWPRPSVDNDLGECARQLRDTKFALLLPALIPTIFTGLFLILFPLVTLGRCCGGCGSRKLRPGAGCCGGSAWDAIGTDHKERLYPAGHVRCIKLSAFLLAIASVAVLVTVPLGISETWEGWAYILDRAEPDVISWLADRKAEVVADLRSADGSLPPPLDNDSFTAFDDAIRLARDTRNDIQGYSDDAALPVAAVSYALAAMPLLLLGTTALFAWCNVRGCGLDIVGFLAYVIGLLFGVIAAVLLVAAMAAFMLDGEMQLQQRTLPGALGWWGVPKCEAEINFSELGANVSNAIRYAAVEGCNQLLQICDGDSTTPANNNPRQFYCPNLAGSNTTVACRSVSDLTRFINYTYAKAGSQVCAGLNCSVTECQEQCASQQLRDFAAVALAEVDEGVRIQRALSNMLTFADCDILVDRATLPFAKLDMAGDGLVIAGCGATFALLLLILGTLVLCKGQKVFFAATKPRAEEVYRSPDANHQPDTVGSAAAGPPGQEMGRRFSNSNFQSNNGLVTNGSWSIKDSNRH